MPMPEMSWEHAAEARAALNAIVSDPEYGFAALSSPRTMSNLLKDLLPDAPKEKTVLVAAAEAGLAETLRDHVAQGVDSDTAVRLTASTFSSSTSFTPEACSWVAGELAIALGISEGGALGAPIQPGQGLGSSYAPGNALTQGPQDGPPPAMSPPGSAQFAPGPVVSPAGPGQFAPGPVMSPPGSAQFAPGPVASPAGPGQFPGAQYPGAQFPGAQYPPPPGFAQPPAPGYGPMMPVPKNNNFAVAALICGVAQFVLWFALAVPGLIAAILALIFGLVSMRQVKRTGESGRGMAITGVVLGALGVVGGIILIALIIIGATVGSHSSY
jgi:hypothetical protein